MNLRRISCFLLLVLIAAVGFTACQPTRNFTTYFNLFYNMERIMDEVEEELLYIREQKTPEPVFVVPFDDLDRRGEKFYNHLERRTMTNEEMRANKIKLDSILIKGSKLMARNNKSDYLDDAIYYIAKTYFYEREWYQSQKKCEELIAGFPESRWYPDAHLVLSMDLMHMGNIGGAMTMLSRTIDIAWGREREDVLIDAFRLNADLQLAEGNVAEALKPYERAMVLSTDDEDLARWEYEIGLIHFRQGDFSRALESFDRAIEEHSPDVLTEFQLGMQRAAALRALGQYDLASEQLEELRDNGNYEPWYGMVELEMLNLAASKPGGTIASDSALAEVDSVSPGKPYSSYVVYERGVRAFRAGDFKTALENFNRAKGPVTPFQRRAIRYSSLLARYFDQSGKGYAMSSGYDPANFPDTMKAPIAEAFYNTARVFASLDIRDSLIYYYDLSYTWSAPGSPEGARVVYARAMMALEADRSSLADSLLELLVADYPLTPYGADARKRLNYSDRMVVDPAMDLYNSGVSHMRVGESQQALKQFHKVIGTYPRSDYAPMAYYAIGLLYEKTFDQLDSAYSYYGRILDLYPKSEQAASVGPLIQAVNQQRMLKERNGAPPEGDGTGINLDWLKENPPLEEGLEEDLIPLNGDTASRSIRNNPNFTPPKGTPKPAPPPGGSGTQSGKQAGTQNKGTRGGTTPPNNTKPAATKTPAAGTTPPEQKPVSGSKPVEKPKSAPQDSTKKEG